MDLGEGRVVARVGALAWLVAVLAGCTSILGIEPPGGSAPDAATSTVSVSPATGAIADGQDAVTVTVTVRDPNGNPLSEQAVSLAVEPTDGARFDAVALTTNAAGIVTTKLTSTRAERKTLTATISGNLVIAQKPTVDFVAGAAARLAFAVPPSNAVAGATIAPAVQIRIEDAQGNAVLSASDAVAMSLETNPGGSSLGGTLVVSAVNGVATFDDLSIDRPGTGYTLTASATDRTPITSGGFEISLGAGKQLVFVSDPGSTVAGAPIAPALKVEIRDAAGNTIPTATDGVTVAIGNNAGTGTLSGTVTVAAISGVATFDGLSIDRTGPGYTLVATATGYTGTETAPFAIIPGPPSDSTSTVIASPDSGLTADGTSASSISVTVRDALGNPISGETVALAVSPTTANTLVQPSMATSATGTASGTLTSTRAGTVTLTATVGASLVLSQKPTVTFVAGPPSDTVSTVSSSPSSRVADGVSTTTVTVTVLDATGNPVSGQTVTLSATGTGNTIGQPGVTGADGTTTGTLASTVAETKTISATAGAQPLVAQPVVTFVPGPPSPTASTVSATPSALVADGVGTSTITIVVRDANGNPIVGQPVAIATTGAGAILVQPGNTDGSGMTTGSVASTVVESKTVTATVDPSGAAVVLSQKPTVTFVAGPPSDTVSTVSSSPSSRVADGVSTTTVTVTVLDATGNPVSGQTVTLSATGTGNSIGQPGATGADGTTTGTLASTVAETKTISATAGAQPLVAQPVVTFVPGPPSPTASTVSATPSALVADGVGTSTITIVVRDANGNPIVGQPVAIATTGAGAILVQPGNTDGSGMTIGSVASTVVESKTVTATVDPSGAAIILSDTPVINFTAVPPTIELLNVIDTDGCISIAYAVRQAQDLRVDAVIEFDDGTGFRRATQAGSTDHDGVQGVTSSSAPAGQSHTFLWDSTADLPHRSVTGVTVRVTPVLGGMSGTARTLAGVGVDNGPRWAPQVSHASGSNSRAVATADLNGDGALDLVTANASGSVSILLGDGNGGFGTASNLTGLSGPYDVAISDFNGDGRLDLAVSNEGFNDVGIFLGDGTGGFGPVSKFTVGGIPYGIDAGDFNEDGRIDLAVADAGGSSVGVLLGNGDGTFGAVTSIASGDSPRGVLALDVDRDGFIDLVTANYSSDDVTVMIGLGNGTFRSPVSTFANASPVALAAGDFDRDGWPDVAVARDGLASLRILRNDGTGGLVATTTYPAAAESPKNVAVRDIDGDGLDDIVTANGAGSTATVFLGNGDATFQGGQAISVGTGPAAVLAADLNRDGRVDLATANATSGDVSVVLSTSVAACSTGFLAGRVSSMGASPIAVALGDFDGDGKPDVAAANFVLGGGGITIALGNGDGTYRTPVTVPAGTLPRTVVAADFNNDGRLDLVSTNMDSDDISVLIGNGDGTFAPAVQRPVGDGPFGVAVGDLDGDSNADLVVSNRYSGTLSILLSNGDGTFGAPVEFAAGADPTTVAVVDLNGDGDLDVAVRTQSGATVLIGNGDGTLAAPTSFDTGGSASAVVAGYVNGDIIIDLVAVNTNNTVGVLLGNGDGTFRAAATTNTDGSYARVALADVNGDGALDAVAVNANGVYHLAVLLGDGGGGLAPPTYYGATSSDSEVVLGDVNGDGNVDILVPSKVSAGVLAVLPGRGDGSFQAVTPVSTGLAPYGLASADFDRDGDQDVAACVLGGPEISVHLGDGTGALGPSSSVAVTDKPLVTVTADFDGDGQDDLASGSVAGANVSVALGNGDGTFGPPATIAVSSAAIKLAVGDINRDGRPDLVVGHTTAVDVLIGNGDGTFQAAVSSSASIGVSGLVIADFDRDGRPDVVTSGSNSIAFLRGNGTGSLAPAVTSSVVVQTGVLRASDVNRDGRLDLMTVRNPDGVAFIPGNGDGTFGVGTSAGFGRDVVAVADFDRDGRLDVASFVNLGGIAVASGNGDGTFQAPVLYATGFSPIAMIPVVLTRDGTIDLVIADDGESTVGALLGR